MKRNQMEHWRIWNLYNPENMIISGDGYVINHIDKNPKNNNINNLIKLTDYSHRSLHHKNKEVSVKTRKKLSDIFKIKYIGANNPNYGKHHSDKTKSILSKIHKGKIITKEHKDAISRKLKGRIVTEETKKKLSIARINRCQRMVV